MKVFCYSSNVALATFSQRLLAEKPQMVDLDKRDCHSIYIRTVSSEFLLYSVRWVMTSVRVEGVCFDLALRQAVQLSNQNQ